MLKKPLLLLDIALIAAVISAASGLLFRACHEDTVSDLLTDLSKREERTAYVALPNPWRREPLSALPKVGDSEIGIGKKDAATFLRMEDRGETAYPVAVFKVKARVDDESRVWFNYSQLIPGANFAFRTDRYKMEGIILEVRPVEK